MSAMNVSGDSVQPSNPGTDILSVLDLWQAVTEARSRPRAAVSLARLVAAICSFDSVTLFLHPAVSPSHSWPDGLRLSGELRAVMPRGAAGVELQVLTGPIGFSVDAASDDLVITAVQSSHLALFEMVGKRLKPGEGMSGQAILGRRPIILDSYAAWPESIPGLAAKIRYAAVAAPLIANGRAIGALTVSDDTPGRRFTEDDAQMLSLFAQQAAVVLEGARRRQQEGVIALDAERARLARDLHDGLAQDLVALMLRADACQALLGAGDEALRERLEAISIGLQQAIRDARATIFALRQPDSDTCSLEGNLAAQASQFESQTHIPVRYTIAGEACQPLPKTYELALPRVAQEALSNVRKHAQATQTTMGLTWHAGGSVSLKITDNGVGFDQTAIPGVNRAGQHFGLVSMRERVEELGGALTLRSSPGGGTCLEVRLSTPAGAG